MSHYNHFQIQTLNETIKNQVTNILNKSGVLENSKKIDLKMLSKTEFLLGYLPHYYSFFESYKKEIELLCDLQLEKKKWMYEAYRRFQENILFNEDMSKFDLTNFELAFVWLGLYDENIQKKMYPIKIENASIHKTYSKL